MPRSPFKYPSDILILLKFGFLLGGPRTSHRPSGRATTNICFASKRLQGKASPFAVFTFASGHPSCKQVLLVVHVRWVVQIGCELKLSVGHIYWAVRTGIELWLYVTGVQTLLLAVRTVYRENQLC